MMVRVGTDTWINKRNIIQVSKGKYGGPKTTTPYYITVWFVSGVDGRPLKEFWYETEEERDKVLDQLLESGKESDQW